MRRWVFPATNRSDSGQALVDSGSTNFINQKWVKNSDLKNKAPDNYSRAKLLPEEKVYSD